MSKEEQDGGKVFQVVLELWQAIGKSSLNLGVCFGSEGRSWAENHQLAPIHTY